MIEFISNLVTKTPHLQLTVLVQEIQLRHGPLTTLYPSGPRNRYVMMF